MRSAVKYPGPTTLASKSTSSIPAWPSSGTPSHRIPPGVGTIVRATLAVVTPGVCCKRSISRSQNATISAPPYPRESRSTPARSTLRGSNPGSMCCSVRAVRTRSPAPTINTKVIAICRVTSMSRPNGRWPVATVAGPSFRSVTRSTLEARKAGNNPKPNAVRVVITAVNASSRASSPLSMSSGAPSNVGSAGSRLSIQIAVTRPAVPPRIARTRLSVISCRARRSRPPPIDRRIAISRRRAMARAMSRLATLAHATTRTNSTAPIRTASGRFSSATREVSP